MENFTRTMINDNLNYMRFLTQTYLLHIVISKAIIPLDKVSCYYSGIIKQIGRLPYIVDGHFNLDPF
jgi:hypothetical protein